MSTAVGDSIRVRLGEVDASIGQVDAYIDGLKDQRKVFVEDRKSLTEERKVLAKALADIEHLLGGDSTDNGYVGPRTGRQVDYPEILAAIAGIGRPVKTPEIAQALGTKSNMIARKLRYLVDHKELGGSKDEGFYTLT